ncbi:MOSC domain-containing protein [Kiloniella laminariae]|uniref:MOSC domain-containing protein n=1 Tax=Kiloniella laminariae TaxID=454162 RepID=UPI000371E969|nr:MOSC N-terminal beta barrel domain-containing protein [Kiloniella laminariae]
MTSELHSIYRYPVKGLSPDVLEKVSVKEGQLLPNDRRFAIAHGTTDFPVGPGWMRKSHFLMLAQNPKLAQLVSRYDEETDMLVLERAGKKISQGKLTDMTGRMLLEQFLASFLGSDARGTPKIVETQGTAFTDIPDPHISLINLASIKDLERVVRSPVDPMRFRGNLYLEGIKAWEENSWIGKKIAIGQVELEIKSAIGRCSATNVNLDTAETDLNIPKSLQSGFGHRNMGVYAKVIRAGTLERKMPVTFL